jgi:D-threo-aldose 1-dehydrogenase
MDRILDHGGAVEALEHCRAQGIIGAIGLGVRSHHFLYRAIESGRFDVILTPYDYTPIRASARPLIERAAACGVGVVNGSPYNAGLLAGLDPDVAAERRKPSNMEDLERARTLWQWCQTRGVDAGALAMQYSLRNERISVTLAGPRTAKEVEANVRHATATLPPDVWDELERFQRILGPAPLGGEI